MRISGVSPLLLPVLLLQAAWVRLRTPRLPEAAGPSEGIVLGVDPAFDLIVLGESPVAGVGAPDHEMALTGQIARALNRRSGCMVHWLAAGRSGATARLVRDELVPGLKGRRADAVIIALGVNDAIELNSETRWKEDIVSLIEAVQDQIGVVRIVLAGVPPLDRFPAFPGLLRRFLGRRSQLLDRQLAVLASEIPGVIHQPMVEGLNDDHFCEDRFHPGISGYSLWGEHLCLPLLSDRD